MKCLLLAFVLFSGLAHAALVEDGSQFSGTFRALDEACVIPAGTDLAGQPVPAKTDFAFRGSIEGLADERGAVMMIAPFSIFDHGGGFLTGSSAQFISDHEFLSEFLLIAPTENGGQPKMTRDDYKLDNSGNLVHTTTEQVGRGNAVVTRACHFKRLD